jgi:hypothetical protein
MTELPICGPPLGRELRRIRQSSPGPSWPLRWDYLAGPIESNDWGSSWGAILLKVTMENFQPREGIEPPGNGSAVRRINHSATLAQGDGDGRG